MITPDMKRNLHGFLIRRGLPMNSFKIVGDVDDQAQEYFKVVVYKLLNVPKDAPAQFEGHAIVYEETYKSS